MTGDQTVTALAFECGDPIQITTSNRTLTGVVYRRDHRKPELTCRGPEPGDIVLYAAIPSNELFRLQYSYYDEYDHTETRLDRYELTPEGKYAWVRTYADAVRFFFPSGSVRPWHDPQLNRHPNRSTAQGFEQEHPTNDSP